MPTAGLTVCDLRDVHTSHRFRIIALRGQTLVYYRVQSLWLPLHSMGQHTKHIQLPYLIHCKVITELLKRLLVLLLNCRRV